MRKLSGLLLLGTMLSGCESSDPLRIPADAVAVESLPLLSDSERNSYQGITNRRRLLINDQQTWTSVWQEMTADRVPPPAVPPIDFTTESVIIVTMGLRPTGGYGIRIEGIEEFAGTLYVRVAEVKAGRGCLVTQATTAPLNAARVAGRFTGAIFIDRTTTKNC